MERNNRLIHFSYESLLLSVIWLSGSRSGACQPSGPNREWAFPVTCAQDEQLSEPNGTVPCQSAQFTQWQQQQMQVCGYVVHFLPIMINISFTQ